MKLLVTDLDRTLLREDKSISEYTARVLGECRARGIKIAFATARPKNRVDLLPFAGLADAVVVSNGAAIYEQDERVAQFGIPAETAKQTTRTIQEAFPDLRLSCEYGDVTYHSSQFGDALWEGEIRFGLDKLPDLPAEKIVVRAGEREYPRIRALLPGGCYAQLCENRLVLIMHETATKINAARWLAARYGIGMEHVLAFGDDVNDVELLRCCGVGVAVSNALEEAKAAADFVCGSNEEDGEAVWLERHILWEERMP